MKKRNVMTRGKRIAAAVVLIVSILGTLGGCSPEKSKNIVFDTKQQIDKTKTKLTFFGFKYEALNVVAIEKALYSFMEEHPDINISYDGIKSPEYYEVLEKRIATGNGDDIIMVDHDQVLKLGREGKLADLSDLSTLENFSELALSQMSADGSVDYLPTSISAFGLYCNQDLLEAHGQKIPENLAEFEAVCDYFVSKGITPIVANNDISLKTVAIAKSMYPFYQQADTREAMAQFNSGEADLAEAFLTGFEFVESMLDRGWVNTDEALVTAKTKDDLKLFAKGDRPFMLTGAWAVPRLRDLKPAFDFEVRPYPILDDGAVMVVNVDTRVSVLADSPHVQEAKQFVEFLTQQDVMWEFVNSQSSFSPLAENRLAEDEAIQSMAPYMTNGRSVLGADDNLQIPIWTMTRQCIEGMLKGNDAEAAVESMKELIRSWSASDGGDGL